MKDEKAYIEAATELAAAIEWSDGTKQWYLNGQLHREDGPAIEWLNGDKEWYLNGKLHREDGPAVEYADGPEREWWLNGKEVTEQEVWPRFTCDNHTTNTELQPDTVRISRECALEALHAMQNDQARPDFQCGELNEAIGQLKQALEKG